MTDAQIHKLLYTVVVLVIINTISFVLKHVAKKTQEKRGIRKSRFFTLKRIITASSLFLSLVVILIIWELDVKSAWVSFTGILTLVAIGFFAIWSLVGNILAGIILYFTSPFKIDDTIEIVPDEICGTVLAINTFFTVLQTEEMHYISVPNSLFFQKYIKVTKEAEVEILPKRKKKDQSAQP